MKPYRETHEFEGVLEAPIEEVWELHTEPAKMCSVFSWILASEVITGKPGEKGCGYRLDMRSGKGRTRAVWFKVIHARPPRSITVRSRVPTRSPFKRLRLVICESKRTLKKQGSRTLTTVTISTETIPIRWPIRILLRFTRAGRAHEAEVEFEKEMGEENSHYALAAS